MIDLNAALKAAKRPERIVRLCLRGDLVAEHQEKERRLVELNAQNRDSLAGNPEARALAEEVSALEAEMDEATYPFRVRGLSEPEWRAIVAANPAREEDEADATLGYNTDTFFDDLVKRCLVPAPSDEQWASMVEVLSSGQFEELRDAAIGASRRKVDVPKSLAASATLRKSDATSK